MLCTRRSIFCIFAFEGIALEHDNFLCKKKPCFSKGLFYQSFQGTILFNGRLDFQGTPEYVYMKKTYNVQIFGIPSESNTNIMHTVLTMFDTHSISIFNISCS